MPQTLTEIKTLLSAHGLRPKHKFGQNFLHDGNQMRRIMEAAAVGRGDVVLEVGPGTGALTERLLEAGAEVVAVEIDRQLEPVLRQRLGAALRAVRHVESAGGDAGRSEPDDVSGSDRGSDEGGTETADHQRQPGGGATLLFADVLAGKHRISPAVVEAVDRRRRGGGYKLIANLPYNVASPLLANLVVDQPAMSDAVVMIQKEVADRLTARPGGKDYGPLGILIQAMCEVRTVGTLAPGCFWPPPKVASAVVHLRRREVSLTRDPAGLSALLQRLFTKRRKQLGSILGRQTRLPAGIDPDARPESLSVGQLVGLAEWLGD